MKTGGLSPEVELPSIEDVEGRLGAFQQRLIQYGKDMFGEDFVLGALEDEEIRCRPTQKKKGRSKEGKGENERATKRENAKSVLQRFLDDREELVRLRVITKNAQDRLHDRIGAAESQLKRMHVLVQESERRRKSEWQNSQAFLTELRKKLASVERKQSRLLALMTRPDDEVLDKVLERHAKKEAIEVGRQPSSGQDAQLNLDDTLSQLSMELKEIERSMAVFNAC